METPEIQPFLELLKPILAPERLWSRAEVLERPGPVPALAGVYGWYFSDLPSEVPLGASAEADGKRLLYLGIAPKEPPKNGRVPSSQTLRSRIRYHMNGNAEGSTLRLSLGCLLSKELGIHLRCVGSGRRRTFTAEGEERLSAWMEQNAYVTWVVDEAPWILERLAIPVLDLPLNLQHNQSHPFHPTLSGLRSEAKALARALAVVPR